MFTIKDFLKATYSFSNWNIRTWLTSKLFRNVEVLSQEELDKISDKAKNAKKGIWSIPNYVNDKGKFTIQE